MPALEMAQETGKLVSWLKREGEQVRKGEMLLEIETDKAVVEIEATGDGVLAGITANTGDVIPVGQTIAWLLQAGESVPARPEAAVVTGRRTDAAPAAAGSAGQREAARPTGAARMSPKARRLAQERGVDLASVRGSGPGGEILADDILAAATQTGTSAPAGAPLNAVGRLMAARTTESWTSVPHFFLRRDLDASALNAAREALLPAVERSHGVRVTHTDLIVAAVGRTLRTHPRMNASWTGEGVVVHPEVHVAIAMAVEGGVATAVVRDADTASPAEIAVRRRDLAERARAGRLQPADITGATFTVSNLGMFGVDAFTAIIVPPQAGILAVGAIADRVVALDGAAVVRPMLTVTLSSDHRVIDGAGAAGFLRDLVDALGKAGSL